MFVGVMQFEILIPGSSSLKDKRRVVRSLRDRLHRDHLVAVAEVGALDLHTIAIMGLSFISNDAQYCSAVLDKVMRTLSTGSTSGQAFELGETLRSVSKADDLQPQPTDDDGNPLWMSAESESLAQRMLNGEPLQ